MTVNNYVDGHFNYYSEFGLLPNNICAYKCDAGSLLKECIISVPILEINHHY